ncbi:MAG: hypothetical protein U0401_15750 [Anaerolineae bacterium]
MKRLPGMVILLGVIALTLACGLGSSGASSDTAIPPYGIDKRPMPTGNDLEQLLPKQVGSFTRQSLQKPAVAGDPTYAEYRSGEADIFMEFALTESAANAQLVLDTAAGETTDKFPTDPHFGAMGKEPSYLKVIGEGAFFAWTRDRYYFSAHAKRGVQDLDAFMQVFPY